MWTVNCYTDHCSFIISYRPNANQQVLACQRLLNVLHMICWYHQCICQCNHIASYRGCRCGCKVAWDYELTNHCWYSQTRRQTLLVFRFLYPERSVIVRLINSDSKKLPITLPFLLLSTICFSNSSLDPLTRNALRIKGTRNGSHSVSSYNLTVHISESLDHNLLSLFLSHLLISASL